MHPIVRFLCAMLLLLPPGAHAAETNPQLRVVGSSTVYPFVATAAEQFGRNTHLPTPIVEATGTGGGIKLFCEAVGGKSVDITNASRRIKDSEIKQCANHGVHRILEFTIGFDGIVIANGKGNAAFRLTTRQLFLALAQEVPQGGKLMANPYKQWSDIDPALPHLPIEVYGPPPTSGTRDAFGEVAMEKGCKGIPEYDAAYPDEAKRHAACHILREDGHYIDAGENDNVIVQKLATNPDALGIFGYSFLEQNADKVQASEIDGVIPSFESIASGKYAVSRSLYVYAKGEHLARRGMKEFLTEVLSEDAAGEDGYMAIKGLIPLPAKAREANREKLAAE